MDQKAFFSVPLHVPKTYLKHDKLIRSDIAICNILLTVHSHGCRQVSMMSLQVVYCGMEL